MAKLSNIVSEGFIWSVGITRPKPGQERRAALYITTLVAAVAVVFVAFFLVLGHR